VTHAHFQGNTEGVKWPSVTSGSHVTTTKKKTWGGKPVMRRTYFRSVSHPDRISSGHVTFTSGQKFPEGGYGATSGCACAKHTSGQVTWLTSLQVTWLTSLPVTSLPLLHRIAPPEMWLCPYPYTTDNPFDTMEKSFIIIHDKHCWAVFFFHNSALLSGHNWDFLRRLLKEAFDILLTCCHSSIYLMGKIWIRFYINRIN
jgi:hypothetical protein